MPLPAVEREQLTPIKRLVLAHCGLSLEEGREETLRRALAERMAARGMTCHTRYTGLLTADPQEFSRLVELLTVNETYFFREPDHLKLILDHLLPDLMKAREGPLRILSAGCSSGEEPYSLAILLRERYGDQCERLFSILGVDIDEGVMRTARRGVFGSRSFRGVAPDLLARHFEGVGPEEFRILPWARELVTLEVANLLAPVFAGSSWRPDVILYRNVSIYFPEKVQRDVFRRLAELLPLGGYLVVGATETLHHNVGILPLVERNGLYVFKKQPEFTLVDRRARRREEAEPAPKPLLPATATGPSPARTQRFEPAPAKTCPDPKQLLDEALTLSIAGKVHEAFAALDLLLQQEPGFIKAHSLRAAIHLNEARYREAKEACLAALGLDSLNLEACLMLGVIARYEGDEEGAVHHFRQAIYLDGACWMAHFYQAELLLLRGEARRARSGYESALRILGDSALRNRCLFPLAFKPDPFMAICRHKLAMLNQNGPCNGH
jgi:chemotaxis protein methyltransferase CheR